MSADAVEVEARSMGWAPKEAYLRDKMGPEDQWLPADKYVEKGKSIMPILKATNKKLSEKVDRQERELSQTKQALKEASDAIEALKEFNSSLNKEKVKEQKNEILTQLSAAKKSGDTDAEVQLTDKLTEVNAAIKEAEKPPVVKPPAEKPPSDAPQVTEEAKTWMSENPWFGNDQRKTGYAQGLANEWKASGKPLGTKEFFNFVDEEMAKQFDRNAERRGAPPKVDSTNNSAGSRSESHTYADLPDVAKEACDRAATRLVGPNRAWKTLDAWRKRYVETYDWS